VQIENYSVRDFFAPVWKILCFMKTLNLIFAIAVFAAVIAAKADGTNPPPVASQPPSPSFADPSKLTATAPETFQAVFVTTKGTFVVIEVTRSLAPNGADRFYNLVRSGYFTDVAFFRVIPGFMCQFGIHGDPASPPNGAMPTSTMMPSKAATPAAPSPFATAGPNTRTTQLFINFG
jgi:peptidyl-prolyl cis-trans isomerase A (cyclophilin A)